MQAWSERRRFVLAVTPLIIAWLHLLFVFLIEARDDWQLWLILVLLEAAVLIIAWRTWNSSRVPDWIPIILIVLNYIATGLLYPLLIFSIRFNPGGGWAG